MKKMYYVTEEFLILSEWLGYRGSSGVSLSINGIELPLDFLGFIYEQIDKAMSEAHRGEPRTRKSSLDPLRIPITDKYDPNLGGSWKEGDYDALVKIDLLEEAGMVLPRGNYDIKIGEFLQGTATLEEDTPLKSIDDVFGGLTLDGLYRGVGENTSNIRVLAKIDPMQSPGASEKPSLICEAFVHDIQEVQRDPAISPAMFLSLNPQS